MSAPELFRFVQGAEVWSWTSSADPVAHEGAIYLPIAISRSEFEAGNDLARANLTVRVPRINELGLRHLEYAQDASTSVTLFVWDADAADFGVWWKGRVAGASLTGAEITINCESILTSSRRNGLRKRATRMCNHAVYHRGCNLDKAVFAVPAEVTAVNGVVLTVPQAALQPDGEYLGGMIDFGPVTRWIVGHAGDQITLMTPFLGVQDAIDNAGWGLGWDRYFDGIVPVTLYPGCNRTRQRCNDRFGNILNRLGFDWWPSRNPYDGSIV